MPVIDSLSDGVVSAYSAVRGSASGRAAGIVTGEAGVELLGVGASAANPVLSSRRRMSGGCR